MHVVAHIYTRGLLATYEKRQNSAIGERAIVITQNNRVVDYCVKAKACGITPGMLKKHASYNLPDGLFIKYRPDNYQELVEEILGLLENFSPRAEIFNEREIFLDLTGDRDIDKALSRLSGVLTTIYCDNLIVSVAETKLMARACSLAITQLPKAFWHRKVQLNRPDTKVAIAVPRDARDFLSSLPVHFLWPLEKKIVEQLQFLGLNNCKQVQEICPDELARHFGAQARIIHSLSCGVDYNRVQRLKNRSRLMKLCLLDNSYDRLHWERSAHKAARELAAALDLRMEGFRGLRLIVTGESGHTSIETRKFARIQYTPSSVATNACLLLDRLKLNEPLYSIMICLEELQPVPLSQMEFFTAGNRLGTKTDPDRKQKLAQVINNLNQKYPARLICFGRNLSLSRREQMLQYWDPLRFNKAEVN